MACASTVAVVVPSPAISDVLLATSRAIWAPMFSSGSFRSISLATVTPSFVIVGDPNVLSRTPLSVISWPAYLPNRIRSPALTSTGTRLPSSFTLPLPAARTVPCCGFSLAVSGMMMPPMCCSPSSRRWTMMRSCSGLTFMNSTPDRRESAQQPWETDAPPPRRKHVRVSPGRCRISAVLRLRTLPGLRGEHLHRIHLNVVFSCFDEPIAELRIAVVQSRVAGDGDDFDLMAYMCLETAADDVV